MTTIGRYRDELESDWSLKGRHRITCRRGRSDRSYGWRQSGDSSRLHTRSLSRSSSRCRGGILGWSESW
jgi:hypothetical protein